MRVESGGSGTPKERRRNAALPVAVVLMMFAAVLSGSAAGAQDDGGDPTIHPSDEIEPVEQADAAFVERPVPPKLDIDAISSGYSNQTLHLKIVEGSQARLVNGSVTAANEPGITEVNATLADIPGAAVERMFDRPAAVLTAEKARIEASSGREQADKNLWFRVSLAPGTDAVATINALNDLEMVEIAYAEPLPVAPPMTPNFEPQQGYLDPAITGIDADFAKTIPGGQGQNVKIIDIEYSWNDTHEDLGAAIGGLVPSGTPCDFFNDNNHGTAVLGEMIGTDNGFGVTGASPLADVGMVNAGRLEGGVCRYRLAEAIDVAHTDLSAGDVILLEQQITGPETTCTGAGGTQEGLVAVEWVLAYYDAIVAATSDGINVVEAAGNGSCNYDNAAYGNPFPAGRPDSGAIIVGAGSAPGGVTPLHSRLAFSGHGARLDLQGYGENVVTTGYGNLQGGPVNEWYTNNFGGTSGASPIVTSAVAILSSIAQQDGGMLTPAAIRSTLKSTGTAQTFGLTGNIGPMPNLNAAFASLCSGALLVANDNLANAATMTGATATDTVNNTCATAETGELTHDNSGGQPPSRSVWWQWTAPADGPVTVDTEGTALLPGNDTVLGVYTGTNVAALTVIGQDDDDGTNLLSKVDFTATAGTTYKIAVDGWNSARSGKVTVNIAQAAGAPLCNGLAATLVVPPGGANFFGTGGNDVIVGTAGVDNVFGLGGSDTICGLGGDDNLNGGNGADWISGGDDNDFVAGQGGVDEVMGDAGHDEVVGGIGNDQLFGGPGRDLLRGQGNDDTINGEGDVDVIFGGSGNDIINTGSGGNRGVDCSGDWAYPEVGSACPVTGNGNNDTITGSPDNDELGGQNGLDTVNGGGGNDLLTGGLGADTLNGDAGDDTLQGQGSADTLNGGGDNDSMSGGAGAPDNCNGGPGALDTADGTCENINGVP